MRFSLTRFGRTRLLVAGASIALVGAAAAVAGVFAAGTPVRVPDNPLGASSAACSNLVARSTAAGSVNYPGAEVEPHVAADPTNPSHLVGAVQQDRWNDGGSNGLTAVVLHRRRFDVAPCGEPAAGLDLRWSHPRQPGILRPGDRSVGELLRRREDRLPDQRLVQRERAGVRRRELDHRQPLDRRRRDLAGARSQLA